MSFPLPALAKSPAFQFYPDDFLGSGKVGMMTPAEVGIYVLLLCLAWNEGGFVYDEPLLARWCRCDEGCFKGGWQMVRRCFVQRGERWFNPRLEKEREKQAAWRAKSAEGGLKSGRARSKAANHPSTTLEPPYEPFANTPSPTPSPLTTTTGGVASAVVLCAAANKAITERWGESPSPLLPTTGAAAELVAAVEAGGIPLDFARDTIYSRTLMRDEPPKGMRYFIPVVRDAWAANAANGQAKGSGARRHEPPVDHVKADLDAWVARETAAGR